MNKIKIGILCVGTELTTGQILNRNASWISSQLTRLGIQSLGHWVIPDDRPLLRKILTDIDQVSDLVFVTGGLGPTTDDFTREIIAEHLNRELRWDSSSWDFIIDRLARRNISPNESHRRQCFYPEGATILTNSKGTAHGFRVATAKKSYVVLPGPPQELAAIWSDHVEEWIKNEHPLRDPLITRHWETLGHPESFIADLSERALEGCPFEIGYRVHVPFVEVKLTYPQSLTGTAKSYLERLTTALAPHTVGRDQENPLEELTRFLDQNKIFISLKDSCSGDYLLNRWIPLLGSALKERRFSYINSGCEHLDQGLSLELSAPNDTFVMAKLRSGDFDQELKIPLLNSSPEMRERMLQYASEKAILFWHKTLIKDPQAKNQGP